MKKIKKTEIRNAIKNCDLTKMYYYAHILKLDSVYTLINQSACAKKYKDNAYLSVAFAKGRHRVGEEDIIGAKEFVYKQLFNEMKRGYSNYTKLPMVGFTRLYFCSPSYGHKDYNKYHTNVQLIPQNQEFVNKIIDLSNRWLMKQINK
jgi:hypothetical protein